MAAATAATTTTPTLSLSGQRRSKR